MDLKTFQQGLEKLSTVTSMFSPFASMLGIGKSILDITQAGASIGQNVIKRVEEGKIIATTDELSELKRIIAELEAANAELDAYIRESGN